MSFITRNINEDLWDGHHSRRGYPDHEGDEDGDLNGGDHFSSVGSTPGGISLVIGRLETGH